MKNAKIAVLMSTYNGELFIREQLNSIYNQKDVDIKLFVRDDGSVDKTLDIVNEFKNKIDIKIVKGKNIGAGRSFMNLLKEVLNYDERFDYYALADQDDVWIDDKLKIATSMIDCKEPTLYCSNVNYFKDNKIVLNKLNSNYQCPNLKQYIIKCEIPGCTYVFNYEMAKIIGNIEMPSNEYLMYRYHDTWIYSLACLYGKIIYDKQPHINYRIHDTNASMKKVTYFDKFILSFSKSKHRKGMRSLHARQLLEKCTYLKDKDIKILKELGEYRRSIKTRIALINDKEICKISGENRIMFALKVITGFF